MKPSHLLTLACLSLSLAMPAMVLAQTATSAIKPTQAQNSTSSGSPEENIKNRLQKVVEENKEQIKGVTTQTGAKRGFLAKVKRVSEETLTVESSKDTLIISMSSEVGLIKDDKPFKLSDLEIDTQVSVVGLMDGEDFNAKLIIVHDEPKVSTQKKVLLGKVEKIDRQKLTFSDQKAQDGSYNLTKTTLYENAEGDTIKSTEVKAGQSALIIFTTTGEGDSSTNTLSRIKILQSNSDSADE